MRDEQSKKNRPLDQVRVLAVDDDDDARELMKMTLEREGAEVVTADCADRALELLEAGPPDVVVSDIGMPEKDGYELIRQVRQLSEQKGGRTPAIAVTAFSRAQDRTQALMAGFQSHIAKPISWTDLVAAIRRMMLMRNQPSG